MRSKCSTPRLEIKNTKKYGNGVFALEDIQKGGDVWILSGETISLKECAKRVEEGKVKIDDPLQIGTERYIELDYLSHAFNHSCEPNTGLRKKSELFALRNIRKGEELTYDYSTTVGPNIPASIWTMKCKCGKKNCRKVLGNILTIPEQLLNTYKEAGALQNHIKQELKHLKKDKKGDFIIPQYRTVLSLKALNEGVVPGR